MKTRDYLQYDFTDIKTPIPIDRREFLKRLGGGIIIILSLSEFIEVPWGYPPGSSNAKSECIPSDGGRWPG